MGLTEGHWFEDEYSLNERQLERAIENENGAYKRGLRDGMDKVSDRAFHVMCDMWGVDAAVKALKHMGMTATTEQITAARKKETAVQERWNRLFKE